MCDLTDQIRMDADRYYNARFKCEEEGRMGEAAANMNVYLRMIQAAFEVKSIVAAVENHPRKETDQ